MPLDNSGNNNGGGSNGGGQEPILPKVKKIILELRDGLNFTKPSVDIILDQAVVSIYNIIGSPTSDFNNLRLIDTKRKYAQTPSWCGSGFWQVREEITLPQPIDIVYAGRVVCPEIESSLSSKFQGSLQIMTSLNVNYMQHPSSSNLSIHLTQ